MDRGATSEIVPPALGDSRLGLRRRNKAIATQGPPETGRLDQRRGSRAEPGLGGRRAVWRFISDPFTRRRGGIL